MRMHILITANKAPEAREHVAHFRRSRDCSTGGVKGYSIGKALEHSGRVCNAAGFRASTNTQAVCFKKITCVCFNKRNITFYLASIHRARMRKGRGVILIITILNSKIDPKD